MLTVAKYEPMGTTIMAKVKASSLTMTSLGVLDVSYEMLERQACLHPLLTSLSPVRYGECIGKEEGLKWE